LRVGIEGRTLQGRTYGVSRYLKNLLRHFAERTADHQFLVYLSSALPGGVDLPRPDVIRYRTLGMRPTILWRHLRLPLAMKKDGVDLHFSPSYFLPLLKVCPSVVVVHDLSIKVHPEWFSAEGRFRFDDIFWREVKRAERIITVSLHSKRDIVSFLGVEEGRVVVIPEAAEEHFRPLREEERLEAVRARYGLGERFLFTVGAIHTRRNLERLITAVARAGSMLGEPLQLLVLGAPAPFTPPVDIWGTAERCGMKDRLVVVDFVPDEELVLLYNACTLFVYPSLFEGFGLPVLEAMACGTPVACSNATSLPEVAGDAAAYFDPLDVEDMAGAIARVLEDSRLREELSRAGLRRAAAFSWSRAAEETIRVCEEAVG